MGSHTAFMAMDFKHGAGAPREAKGNNPNITEPAEKGQTGQKGKASLRLAFVCLATWGE